LNYLKEKEKKRTKVDLFFFLPPKNQSPCRHEVDIRDHVLQNSKLVCTRSILIDEEEGLCMHVVTCWMRQLLNLMGPEVICTDG
jgi:hypothetical protein